MRTTGRTRESTGCAPASAGSSRRVTRVLANTEPAMSATPMASDELPRMMMMTAPFNAFPPVRQKSIDVI